MSGYPLAPEVQRRLRWVQTSRGHIDLARFPDFLIIGPQRTGTTWLHVNLELHPQIYLAEQKEVYYFNNLAQTGPHFRSRELAWYLRQFRIPAISWLRRNWRCWRDYQEWYRPIVRGEATASYATLGEDIISEITALNPDIKAIMMIRDPIERAWSHANKDLARKRGRRLTELPDAEVQAFLRDPYQRLCARYVENYDRWLRYLKPGHLFAGFFDDIAARPAELLLEVMSFLGVRPELRYIGSLGETKINPTRPELIPDRHRDLLLELFSSEREAVERRFGRSWP